MDQETIHAASMTAGGEDAANGFATVAALLAAARTDARQAATRANACRGEAVTAVGVADDLLGPGGIALGSGQS